MYHATLTPIDLGSLDREAAIIYNQDRLVAVAVKLADPEHGPDVGNWHVEFYARQPGRTSKPFFNLDSLIGTLRRDAETDARSNMLQQPLLVSRLEAVDAPIEIIEVQADSDRST